MVAGSSMSGRGVGGGGHATAGGVRYQVSVAAWLTVGMLAEADFEPPWGWPREATITAVRSETGEATDDIFVDTSRDAHAYLQAKNSIDLGEPADSEFGKTVVQFADQYLDCRDGVDDRNALDPGQDRLVLVVGNTASGTIREHLRNVLDRIRDWPADKPLLDAASNDQEKEALSKTIAHINRAFQTRDGADADDAELRQMLSLMYVFGRDFGGDDGSAQREALQSLRMSVLVDPTRAGDAWHALCNTTTDDTAGQSGVNLRAAQAVLRRESIPLVAPRSYRNDVNELTAYTHRTLDDLKDLADIELHGRRAKIARETPAQLTKLVEQVSCLVVGNPGAGKSATLFELGHMLLAAGDDVIAIAADHVDAGSLGALRNELGLQHDLVKVLENWPSERGVLLIDALDVARGDHTEQALLDLIQEVRRRAPNWTVVASIRCFDLRYNRRLRQLFPVEAQPEEQYVDPEFASLNHFRVALLTDGELDQLRDLVPNLHSFLQTASPAMKTLVRTPFNLRLLAQLLDADVDPTELQPMTTQLELLERYWELRVLEPQPQADMREALLRRVCELIIEHRSLRVHRADIQALDGALLATLPDILSAQVLVETTLPTGAVNRDVIAFAHHVLFDYAAARLLLGRNANAVVEALVQDRLMAVLIRPSLDMHLRSLWMRSEDRAKFWELVLALAARAEIQVATIVGASIAAEMASTLDDLVPLIAAIRASDPVRRNLGETALGQVLASVDARGLSFVGADAGPWTALAAELSDA
jgi:hypothetical protein